MTEAPPPPPADDAIEHLWNAAQEFLRSMRLLVDAADEFVAQQRGSRTDGDGRGSRVQPIDIDTDTDSDSDTDSDA